MMLFEDFGTHTPISTIFYVDFQMIKFLLKGYSLCCTPSPKNLIKVTSIYEKKIIYYYKLQITKRLS